MSHEGLVQELREYAKNGNKFLNGWSLYIRAAAAIEILDRLCDRYEAELDRVTAERDAAIKELHGKCSVCKSYAPFHRRDKCLNCKWDNASPACLIEYQEDNWEWHGVEDENNS